MATYPINYILEHASKGSKAKDNVIVDGSTTTIFQVVADYGYKFVATSGNENCPTIERKNTDGTDRITYFADWASLGAALSSDLREYTTPPAYFDETKNLPPFYVRAIAVRNESVVLKEFTINNNVANTTATYKQTGKTTFDITLEGNTEGSFTTTPKITFVDAYGSTVTKNMTVDGKTATLTITTTGDELTFSGTFTPKVTSIPITYGMTNCAVTPTPTETNVGDALSFTLKPDSENYVITSLKALWTDTYGATNEITGEVASDGTSATLTFEVSNKMKAIQITGIAETAAPSVSVFGSINAYVVDNDILKKFAATRFRESSGYILTEIDLGDYVNRIKNIYVDLPDTYKTSDTLRCGNYNTNIDCQSITTAVMPLDFGDVELFTIYGSSFEYENTELNIYLPFVGLVPLPGYLVGHTINLSADINLITGYGLYTIKTVETDEFSNVPIKMVEFTPSSDVLYNVGYEYNVVGSDKWDENFMKNGNPMLIRTLATPLDNDIKGAFEYGRISTMLDEFMQFRDVKMNHSNISDEVYNEIIRLLEEGIYL